MVLILESRSHLDLGDLPNLLAAELGVMTVRLERAIRSLDEVAQVHVNRWGDGAAHLHQWFLGRPAGRLQLRGPFLAMWDEILEPVPEGQWRSNLAHIAAWLEEFGGRAQVAPPRIEWHAPSTFAGITAIEDPAVDATLGGGTGNTNERARDADASNTAITTMASDTTAGDATEGDATEGDATEGKNSAGKDSVTDEPALEGAADHSAGAAKDAPTERAQTAHAQTVHSGTEVAQAEGDWTAVDYHAADEVSTPPTDAVPSDEPAPELASDNSETVSVRIPSQLKRVREERSGRPRTPAPDVSMDFINKMADDNPDFDFASDSR
jgi:hypothetical protein